MSDEILIVGSLNMDMVMNMDRMPVTGETVLGNDVTHIPGGKGANQACAAGKLGGNTKMLGCVGKDESGSVLINNLKESGVDVSGIRISDKFTGTAAIYVNGSGDNSIVVIPGANHGCDSHYLKEMDGAFQESTYVLLQMEIPEEAVYYAVRRAKELGKTVILNPAPAPDSIPDEILSMVDYLTPNETELLKLSGQTGEDILAIERGAREMVSRGVRNVIVTLGKQGCMLLSGDTMECFPARSVESVDTTAAGDCFNGAFAVGLSEGLSAGEAIRFANLASSIAVTRKGAQNSLPTREEVEQIRQRSELAAVTA